MRKTKEEQSIFSSIDVERIFLKVIKENNWKREDFAAEETKEEQSLDSSINVVHKENVKPEKNHLMNQVQVLQNRVNNLSTQKRKTSFVCFKVKHQNIFGLALIDTGNLVHSAIVSGAFLESIGTRSNTCGG